MDIFLAKTVIPLDDWAREFFPWIALHYRGFFTALVSPIDWTFDRVNEAMIGLTDGIGWMLLILIAWRLAGWKTAVFTAVSLGLLGGWNPVLPHLDIWDSTMTTMALVVTAVAISVLIGVPIGIAASKNRQFEFILRPLLDAMQTIPTFVYLLPVVMLVGVGGVAGVIAVIVFAIPPMIRLTNLGIREVDREVVEAAYSFGATGRQVLFDVEIPLAMRTIMAGLNQTLMLALSMVVIASMIGAPGLGQMVLVGIRSLNFGSGVIGGVGLVLLAMVLDRMTQSLGKPNELTSPSLSLKGVFDKIRAWTHIRVNGGMGDSDV
jgi:glycine betaine/proline transport system permease protein